MCRALLDKANLYGSGRFCERACAARYSTQHQAMKRAGVTSQPDDDAASSTAVAPPEPAVRVMTLEAESTGVGSQRIETLADGRRVVVGLNTATLAAMAPRDETTDIMG